LILLSGTAGSGKRTAAALLAVAHGFWHLDLSGIRPAQIDQVEVLALLAEVLGESACDLIVTCPTPERSLVRVLQSLGFEWIWFDSDRGRAKPVPLLAGRRDRVGKGHGPRHVETFEADGSFRPLDKVAVELLAGSQSGAPRLVTEPVPTSPANLSGLAAAE